MLRNPEVKKLFTTFLLLSLVFVILAVTFGLLTVRHFRNSTALNHAAIVGAVIAEYPQAEQQIISGVLETDANAVVEGQEALERYGLYATDLIPETELLQRNLEATLFFFVLFAVLFSGASFLTGSKFIGKQYAYIQELTSYARQIESGDYSLDIRDNSEGDLSILKNEIYKITTTLKTQAESLQKDKLALADSMADISHQLKTPMTSMLVLNDLLESDVATSNNAKFLQRMKAQLTRVEWLVTSMLKLAKFDAGTVIMKKEPVKVWPLVDKAVAALEIPLEIKMQQVRISGAEDASFRGDFNWSCEALINILKNCIEHTPQRGKINIAIAENPIFTEIKIADNGVGIHQEDLPYLFHRFYKGKNAGDDSVGIGLAMAHTIVAKQDGDITVKSELGTGTQFTLKFYHASQH